MAGHRNMPGTGEIARLERSQQAKGQKVVGGDDGGQVGCRIEESVAGGLSRLAIIGCSFRDIAGGRRQPWARIASMNPSRRCAPVER